VKKSLTHRRYRTKSRCPVQIDTLPYLGIGSQEFPRFQGCTQPAEVWRGVPSQRKSRRSRETQPSAESLRSDSTEIRAHHKLAAVNYGTIFGASVFTQECACCILVTVHSVYVLSSSLRMSDLATPWSTLPYGSLRRCHCETGAGRARPIRYPDPPNC
jgi:hypothetical protein